MGSTSMKSTIRHDAEQFQVMVGIWLGKRDLVGAIDVITREGQPENLLAVVRSFTDFDLWYCNGKVYTTYQHAYAAIGAAIDRANPDHRPLSDRWEN